MKKYLVIIFLAICAIIYVVILNTSLSKAKSELRLKNVEISTLKDSVKVVISKNGDLTFKFQSVQIESKERKDALELLGFELSDLRQRDIKQKNIISALNAKLSASGSGTVIMKDSLIYAKGDSIKVSYGKWTNNYLTLNPFLTGNNLDFDYLYEAKISLIQEKNVVSAIISDPNAKIVTANSITIENKKRWWDKWYFYLAAGSVIGYEIAK
jgi:hypothetical protein